MNSKEKILSAIALANLPEVKRPEPISVNQTPGSVEEFGLTLKSIGGSADILPINESLAEYLKKLSPYKEIFESKDSVIFRSQSIMPLLCNELEEADLKLPKEFTLSILSGDFGVSENGAVWVRPLTLRSRLALFSTEHLVIVAPRLVVPTMHEAYSRINISDGPTGYFIAGPSKTADIEQNLVIGAQGARSLLVLFSQVK